MIDSHAHIDTKPFDSDRPRMLQRAWEAGLQAVIVPDIEPARRAHLIDVVNDDARLYRGIGIHPHHIADQPLSELDRIEEGSVDSKVVAIGEIGLDYYYDFAPRDTQLFWFRKQIGIAKRTGLPIIVHNRDADDDVLQVLTEEQDGTLRGVLHCFSSGIEVLERALELGFHVSFTGNITFKKSVLSSVVSAVPADRFMLETDSPYITPEPHRGTRNEPAHVALVAEKIAEIRGTTMNVIAEITTRTARSFFGLFLMLLAITSMAVAQPTPPVDEDYPDDRDWEVALDNYYADSIAYEKWIKPRKLGIGVTVGSLTPVEIQQLLQTYDYRATGSATDPSRWSFWPRDEGPSRSESFSGLVAYGGTVTYGLFTSLVLEGTFLYSENTTPALEYGLDPITYTVGELTALYSLNPYSRVNFLPHGGLVYTSIDDGTTNRTKFGVNFGVGIGANIDTPVGLFYPMFNVRFNFLIGTDQDRIVRRYTDPETNQEYVNSADPSITSRDLADVNTLHSILRFTLLYYIPF